MFPRLSHATQTSCWGKRSFSHYFFAAFSIVFFTALFGACLAVFFELVFVLAPFLALVFNAGFLPPTFCDFLVEPFADFVGLCCFLDLFFTSSCAFFVTCFTRRACA